MGCKVGERFDAAISYAITLSEAGCEVEAGRLFAKTMLSICICKEGDQHVDRAHRIIDFRAPGRVSRERIAMIMDACPNQRICQMNALMQAIEAQQLA